MRGFNLMIAIVAVLALASTASAQYWFQTGARGSNSAGFNSGAKVSIETVYQNVSYGSLGFWIGEDLSNGAFVQMGYEIPNQSGYFPANCTPSGCTNDTYISRGVPTWFWEYFPAGYEGSQFYGGIGANASAGPNGSFNTYSFESYGNTWNFYFNNKLVGSADMGTASSGPNPPVAFGEYAGTNTNTGIMQDVTFKNLKFYDGTAFKLVPKAYSYIGYGKGSLSALPNPYGIEEVNDYVDYFMVGSGLPLQNHTTLWELGYNLNISSQYGNIAGSWNYSAYSSVSISAPKYVYITNSTREMFTGWSGSGIGSYSGSSTTATVTLNSNITETALWQLQYLVNVSNAYGLATGSGWYAAGAVANIGLSASNLSISMGKRLAFAGWSNGLHELNITVNVNRPLNLSPQWQTQYLVNASVSYGKIEGTGWYIANSTATLYPTEQNISISSNEKESFYKWSNGSTSARLSFVVNKPVLISAIYAPMYLATLKPVDAYNSSINGVAYGINGKNYSTDSVYLFAGLDYNIQYVIYKGVEIGINKHISINSPQTVAVKVPAYNVEIRTVSLFGTPVNASFSLTFKNGTQINGYTGSNGMLTLSDVPEGYSKGYASFMGIRYSIATSTGTGNYLTILTPSALVMIAVGISIIAASGIVADIIERRRNKKLSEK
ncbi:MAG: hypothetical protein QXW10_00685 [Candidatus Micrarchaeaceae archaeon]